MPVFDILIAGAGAAGLSAAAGAAAAGCKSILVADSGNEPGGVLGQCLHRGFTDGMNGRELADRLYSDFRKSRAEIMFGTEILKVYPDRTADISCAAGLFKVSFRQFVNAAGCTEIPFGALGIAGTRPAGIYTAGQVQKMVNIRGEDPGNDILVIGSGDLGLIMAGTLASMEKNVIGIIEKNDTYSGMARNYRDYAAKYGIGIRFGTRVTEVRGEERVSSAVLSSGEEVACSTIVAAAGLVPDRQLTAGLEDEKWIHLCGNCRRVHSMIESVIRESEETGRNAWTEIQNDRQL